MNLLVKKMNQYEDMIEQVLRVKNPERKKLFKKTLFEMMISDRTVPMRVKKEVIKFL